MRLLYLLSFLTLSSCVSNTEKDIMPDSNKTPHGMIMARCMQQPARVQEIYVREGSIVSISNEDMDECIERSNMDLFILRVENENEKDFPIEITNVSLDSEIDIKRLEKKIEEKEIINLDSSKD